MVESPIGAERGGEVMKNNWINGCIYPCKRIGSYPQIYVERVFHGKYKGVSICCFERQGEEGTKISLTTRYARLLLKRLKMCLGDKGK